MVEHRRTHDPVEMHDARTVVAASFVMMVAAAGLVLALQTPTLAVAVGATAFAATRARRFTDRGQPRRDRHTGQTAPATGASVDR